VEIGAFEELLLELVVQERLSVTGPLPSENVIPHEEIDSGLVR
jgi:hypothetical protein